MRAPRFPAMVAAVAVTTGAQLPVFLTGALAVQIRGELHVDEQQLGIAVAAFFCGSAVCGPVVGRIADKVGSGWVMRLGALLSTVVLAGIATGVRGWPGLIGALALGGIANGGAQPAANLMLTRDVPRKRQGFAFGVKQAAIPAAILLAGLAVPAVALTVGWRWAFAGAAVFALLVAAFLPRGGRPSVVRSGVVAVPPRAASPIARGPLVVLAVGAGLGSAAANTLGSFFVLSAVTAGIANGTAGLLAVLGGVSSMAMRLAGGASADRRRTGHLHMVAGLLAAGTAGFLLLAAGPTWAVAPATVLAYGFGWGWAGVLNFAVARRHPGRAGQATGTVQAGTATGGMLGPLAFGFLAAYAGYSTAWLADAAGIAVGAVIVLVGARMLRAASPVRPARSGARSGSS